MFTRRLRRGAVAVTAALLAAGCTRDAPLEPDEPVVGTYQLTAVNGEAPPQVIVQVAQGTLEVLGGSLVMNADHTFTELLQVRSTPAGGEAETSDAEISGTYSVSGRTVTFASEAGPWQGTASDGSMVYPYINNASLLFERD
jgi:hypothetical protein